MVAPLDGFPRFVIGITEFSILTGLIAEVHLVVFFVRNRLNIAENET